MISARLMSLVIMEYAESYVTSALLMTITIAVFVVLLVLVVHTAHPPMAVPMAVA